MGNLSLVGFAKDTQMISNNQTNFNLEDMMREDILWEMFKKFRDGRSSLKTLILRYVSFLSDFTVLKDSYQLVHLIDLLIIPLVNLLSYILYRKLEV